MSQIEAKPLTGMQQMAISMLKGMGFDPAEVLNSLAEFKQIMADTRDHLAAIRTQQNEILARISNLEQRPHERETQKPREASPGKVNGG